MTREEILAARLKELGSHLKLEKTENGGTKWAGERMTAEEYYDLKQQRVNGSKIRRDERRRQGTVYKPGAGKNHPWRKQ